MVDMKDENAGQVALVYNAVMPWKQKPSPTPQRASLLKHRFFSVWHNRSFILDKTPLWTGYTILHI